MLDFESLNEVIVTKTKEGIIPNSLYAKALAADFARMIAQIRELLWFSQYSYDYTSQETLKNSINELYDLAVKHKLIVGNSKYLADRLRECVSVYNMLTD